MTSGKTRVAVGKSGKIYSQVLLSNCPCNICFQALREEMGRYATQHGVEATVQVLVHLQLSLGVLRCTQRSYWFQSSQALYASSGGSMETLLQGRRENTFRWLNGY